MPTYARRQSPFDMCYDQVLRRHFSVAQRIDHTGHLRCDVLEQVDAHLKTPPKIVFGKYQILIEI
jgi:hypothetical protein